MMVRLDWCLTTLTTLGHTVLCGLTNGSVSRVCRPREKVVWNVWVQRTGRVTALDFNSEIVAVGGSDRSVAVLDFESGTVLRYLDHLHQSAITALVLQGRRLISCSHEKTVSISSLTQPRTVTRLSGHSGPVTCLSLLGQRLATGGHDKTIRLWDISSFTAIHVYTGHRKRVLDLKLESSLVISSGQDSTVRLWRVDSPTCVRVIQTKLHVQSLSVTEALLVIKDRSNSIYVLSLPDCTAPQLPSLLQTNSPQLPSLVLRNLQTYASGGDILNVKAQSTGNGSTVLH